MSRRNIDYVFTSVFLKLLCKQSVIIECGRVNKVLDKDFQSTEKQVKKVSVKTRAVV